MFIIYLVTLWKNPYSAFLQQDQLVKVTRLRFEGVSLGFLFVCLFFSLEDVGLIYVHL